MKRINIISFGCFLLLFTISLSGYGEAVATQQQSPVRGASVASLQNQPENQWEKTVAEGKKEGKVMVYTIIGSASRQALSAAFEKRYGIQLEFWSGARGAEITQRLLTERQAGLYLADAVIAGTTDLIPDLKPKGLLQPLDSFLILPEAMDAKAWRGGQLPFLDKQHTAVGMLVQYLRHLIRNTDLVKEGEITSYKDLLKPQWKGKAVLRDPTTTGNANTWITFLALKVWGLEPTKEFLRQFAQTDPAILRDTRLQVEWVARGKYPLGIATRMENTDEFVRKGAPIAWVRVAEGGLISAGSSSLGIINRPAHPNAVKVFLNWLLTREGQTVLAKAYGYPSGRSDVSTEGIDTSGLPTPGEKFYLDDEENILAKSNMLVVGKEIFSSMVK